MNSDQNAILYTDSISIITKVSIQLPVTHSYWLTIGIMDVLRLCADVYCACMLSHYDDEASCCSYTSLMALTQTP